MAKQTHITKSPPSISPRQGKREYLQSTGVRIHLEKTPVTYGEDNDPHEFLPVNLGFKTSQAD